MTKQTKRELLKAIRPRYLKASQTAKGRILDEFVAVTGYNRKYAIHLLHNGPPKRSTRKDGRRRRYGPDVIAGLVQVCAASGHLCGKWLQPFLPELVEVLERHGEISLTSDTKTDLLQMSAAAIDRRLKSARTRLPLRGRSTTKPGSLLKDAIPVAFSHIRRRTGARTGLLRSPHAGP
jgi:hypothetical protein